MEPVSLAFGVLPVIGGAIKGWQIVHKKLKVFRHYSRELQRVQKQIDRQSHFFRNEIHLLLKPAVQDVSIIESMLRDPEHALWKSDEFEAAMRASLGKNYDACLDVIQEVGSTTERFQELFECFESLTAQKRPDESSREAIRRLRDRVKVSYDETKLKGYIQDIRDSFDDLRNLRAQTSEMNKPWASLATKTDLKKRGTREYDQLFAIRQASTSFHEALGLAWSETATHGGAREVRHTVRLFLDTQVEDDVYMNVVISCFGHGPDDSFPEERTSMEKSITLQIRSQPRNGRKSSKHPNITSAFGSASEHYETTRRVRFAQQDDSGVVDIRVNLASSAANSTGKLEATLANLCSKDLCSKIYHDTRLSLNRSDSQKLCFGYIDTHSQESFRHFFQQSPLPVYHVIPPPAPKSGPSRSMSMSMNDMLRQPVEARLSIVDQFKLGRDLGLAVLKFFSTPWLKEYFSLCDLSFLRRGKDLQECLKTLHVGHDFVQCPSLHDPSSTDGFNLDGMKQAVEDAKMEYGIRNLTLWSLGIILLQIGMWSKIDEPENIPGIRRLSSQVCSLGPRYRDLTKKCLNCDFGCGEDLSEPRLQQAVYEGLICELEDIISSLDTSEA